LGMEVILFSFVSYPCIVGKPYQVMPNQQPVPNLWNRSGNARFKRRKGTSTSRNGNVKFIEPRNYYLNEEADAFLMVAGNIM